MWTVLKLNKISNLNMTLSSLRLFFGTMPEVCLPKIKSKKKIANKLFDKDVYILDKYLIIYHNKLNDSFTVNKLNYINGVDYCLNGFESCQKNISDFVIKCKKNQSTDGYINSDFFNLETGMSVKFSKGPFINFVSKIIEIQKNKFKILAGNYSIYFEKKENCLTIVN